MSDLERVELAVRRAADHFETNELGGRILAALAEELAAIGRELDFED